MSQDDLVGYDEAARITGIKKATLYAMVHQRRLPHFRFGGRLVRFSKQELETWVDGHYIPENATDERTENRIISGADIGKSRSHS